LDAVHLPSNRNAILNLDHSFWHSPSAYRPAMEEWDPAGPFDPKGERYLVGLQSYLGIAPRRTWEVVGSYCKGDSVSSCRDRHSRRSRRRALVRSSRRAGEWNRERSVSPSACPLQIPGRSSWARGLKDCNEGWV
jgi:hypothetical protein